MDVEEALDFVNELIRQKIGKPMNDSEIKVFRGSWQGLTYEQIDPLSPGYLIKDVGPTLWRKLSQALGFKVVKKNFRAVIEAELRKQRSHSPTPPQPEEPEQGNTFPPPSFKLQPLTERVREWQLDEDLNYEELNTVETISFNDPNFVGREEAIADLDNLINQGVKLILIQAEGGVGKTTLAENWFKSHGLKPLKLEVGTTPHNIQAVENWLRIQLIKESEEKNPEYDFFTMLEKFKDCLAQESQRKGIFIDNLEPALINGQFIEPHRNYIDLLTFLADPSVNSITLITSREPLYEHEVTRSLKTYQLEGLTKEAWEEYFYNSNISIDIDTLYEIHRAYGGNAEVMYILCADIKNQFQGDLKAYWQENRSDLLVNPTLENLVKRQFKKLKDDNDLVYKLLCRMAFYSNSDVSDIPKVWLFCLLWDVPKTRRNRIIHALSDRSLVKFNIDGYYLHPVIREEAIERLKSIEEIEAKKLLLIKKEIDKIFAPYQKLQDFLRLVKEKSSLVNVPCHPVNVRAFYYSLFYDLTTTRHIAGELGAECKFEDVDEDVFYYDRIYQYLYDLYLDLTLVSIISCDSYYDFTRNINWCDIDPVRDPEMFQLLESIKSELPKMEEAWDKFDDEEWLEEQSLLKERLWITKSEDWIDMLTKNIIIHRKLPLNWHFSKEEINLLDEYYDTNKMLLDCLNSSFEVSDKIQDYLETTLFMPINEINNYKVEKFD